MPTEMPNERTFREPGSMQLDPSGEGIAIDETRRLIASNKVEGTPVFNRSGERLGYVYNFMVDKFTGQVAYAVMSFGGFLGVGESYHPLPWKTLTFDRHRGGPSRAGPIAWPSVPSAASWFSILTGPTGSPHGLFRPGCRALGGQPREAAEQP